MAVINQVLIFDNEDITAMLPIYISQSIIYYLVSKANSNYFGPIECKFTKKAHNFFTFIKILHLCNGLKLYWVSYKWNKWLKLVFLIQHIENRNFALCGQLRSTGAVIAKINV